MLYLDFSWDLSPNKLILDDELDLSTLGWQNGDVFKLQIVNGKKILVKLDPLESFVNGSNINSF